jgi:hypothetical protein
MATRIKLRRDTAANWTTANPILALGEPGLETDTRKVKYGDGSTTWNGLSYAYSGTGTGTDYTLPTATGSVLGGVKIGARLTITDGVLSADVQAGGTGTDYTLPTATGSVLGGIKIGSGLSIDGSGVVSVTGGSDYTLPIASGSVLGGVKVGSGLVIDVSSGVLSNTVTTGDLEFSLSTITANNANFQLNSVGGNVVLNPTGTVAVGTGSGTIILNGNSGLIQMPTNGQIYGASGATYSLRDVNTIYFSDGTTQTSASLVGDVSSLVNGAQEVILSSTGTTTFPGNIQLPQVDVTTEYENVEALSVNSGTVVIAGGEYPIPVAGWLYNGIEIQSVIPLSGNYSITLVSPFGDDPGFYTLTSFPNSVLTAIVFSDGSRQTTAYTGTNTGPLYVTATIDLSQIDQDIVPDSTGVRNLGSDTDKWRTLYLSSSTFYVGTATVTVSGTNLLINGTAISGGTGTSLDIENSWTPPDTTSWQIKTYSGNFSGTYEQDITGLTYTCAPANTATDSTFILINRNDWTEIDTVVATIDELRLDGVPVGIVSIVDDTYPDGVRINVDEPVTISSATVVVVEYRTLGSGPVTWFDFANTPNGGTGLIGGEINFHTHVRLNDGLDGAGGDVVTLNFNTASGDFDQSKLSHGAASSSTFTVFSSSSTGIAYQTNWGAGQLDQIKVQWSAKLYYNGSWFAE